MMTTEEIAGEFFTGGEAMYMDASEAPEVYYEFEDGTKARILIQRCDEDGWALQGEPRWNLRSLQPKKPA